MKSLDAPKDVLKQMLIQRYYAGRAQDNVPQPFPIYTSEGWKIKESTILEYVYCLLDVGVYDGGIIFCCMKALLRQNDKENAQRLQEQAINKRFYQLRFILYVEKVRSRHSQTLPICRTLSNYEGHMLSNAGTRHDLRRSRKPYKRDGR